MSAPDLGDLQRAATAYCTAFDEWHIAWAKYRIEGASEHITPRNAPPHLTLKHDQMMAAYEELHRVALGAGRPNYVDVARERLELEDEHGRRP